MAIAEAPPQPSRFVIGLPAHFYRIKAVEVV